MGEEGGTLVAEALLVNRSLKILKSNHLGLKGAKVMGKVLEINDVLLTLEAPNNSIGSEGAIAIAAGLEKNTSLTSIKCAIAALRHTSPRRLSPCLAHALSCEQFTPSVPIDVFAKP